MNYRTQDTITFDSTRLRSLKQHYARAVERKAETFEFAGKTLLTSYAKYMIEYLEGQLGSK